LALAFIVVGLGAFLVVPLSRQLASVPLSVFAGNCALMVGWIFPLTVLHEAGHALAARALGLRVHAIILGSGPPLLEGHLGRARVTLSWMPLMGLTVFSGARQTPRLALRGALVILAGPLANAALLAGVTLAVGVGRMVEPEWLGALSPLTTLQWASVLLVVISLVPYRYPTPFGLVRSDGGHILHALRHPDDVAENLVQTGPLADGNEHLRRGELEAALSRYREGLAESPGSFLLRHNAAVTRVNLEDYRRAREELMALAETAGGREPAHRPLLNNNIAYCDLMLAVTGEAPELLEEAARTAGLAYREAPAIPALAGTRGAVLVAAGQLEPGLELLRAAFRRHGDPRSRATTAGWIAMGEARRGAAASARRWLETAEKLDREAHSVRLAALELDRMNGFQ
jgi:tetratricopeptide (TPR) repeat protein